MEIQRSFKEKHKVVLENLQYLKQTLVDLKKEELVELLSDYAAFMILKAMRKDRTGTRFSPFQDVDEIWHTHLLDPEDYSKFCIACFGELIGHNSKRALDSESKKSARRKRTRDALELLNPPPATTTTSKVNPKNKGKSKDKHQAKRKISDTDSDLGEPSEPEEPPACQEAETSGDELDDASMQIFVQYGMTEHKLATLDVSSQTTIRNVKKRVKAYSQIPVKQQRLIHCGKQLEDGRTLADYDIQKESLLYVMLKLTGC